MSKFKVQSALWKIRLSHANTELLILCFVFNALRQKSLPLAYQSISVLMKRCHSLKHGYILILLNINMSGSGWKCSSSSEKRKKGNLDESLSKG